MFRVVFSRETAIEAIKDLYAWMAENQSLAACVMDIVVNHHPKGWEAVAYVAMAKDR